MKIALIGYGKMGRMVEQIALKQGHQIVSKIDPKGHHHQIDAQSTQQADLCIDFSHPAHVLNNIRQAAALGKSLVVGTTGWYEHIPQVKEIVSKNKIGLIYAPNFSIGMSLFLKIVEEAATLINKYEQYDVGGFEAHHNQKVDAPSGATHAIANALLKHIKRKKKVVADVSNRPISHDEIHFASLRCGSIPGIHDVIFDSPYDTIEIKHTARTREGFAYGAIAAAEWLADKKGFYTLDAMLN